MSLPPPLPMHLNTAVERECTQLELDNGQIVETRPAYAGKVLLKVKIKSTPSIATLRPNVFTAKEATPQRTPSLEHVEFSKPNSRMMVKEFVTHGAKKLDLTEASVIVSGGRGMGGPQNYKILDELAEAEGGAVLATRGSVGAGQGPN